MLGVVSVTRSISSVIAVPLLCSNRHVNLLPLAASISKLSPLVVHSSCLHQQRLSSSSICSRQQHCRLTTSLFLMNPRFTLAATTSLSGSRLEGLSGRARRCNVSNAGLLRATCDSILPSTSKHMNARFAISVSSSQSGCRLEGLTRRGRKCQVLLHPTAGSGSGPSCVVRASLDSKSISQFSSRCFWKAVRGEVMSSSGGREKEGMGIECSSSQGGGDKPVSSSTLLPLTTAKGFKISFCPRCGGAIEEKIPVGEHEVRYVCTACGAVHYQNPKMVVGCLIEHEDQVLLCRRNIEPAHGLWTLPAGYMEIGESAAEGAARETLEEACAEVQVLGLFAHIDLPFIGQSYIIFRARLKNPHFAPGLESLECALFKLSEIPFDSLAFSSIHLALKLYVEDTRAGKYKVHHGVIEKRLGAGPSDLKSYRVRDLLSS